MRTRPGSASAIESVRPTCRMKASSGCGVDPRICTRRDAKWITNTVYTVTKPRHVQTSVVKKSAPTIAWARRKVCHEVGRSGTGGRPFVFRMRAIVERPTRCPTFFSAPWIRVSRATSRVGPFTGHELSVPSQQRIGRHDRGDLPQCPPSKLKRPHGKPPSVVIGEAQTPPIQLRAQDAILFHQVRERPALGDPTSRSGPRTPSGEPTCRSRARVYITGRKLAPSLVLDRAMGQYGVQRSHCGSSIARNGLCCK
jgi:hypothetical protein